MKGTHGFTWQPQTLPAHCKGQARSHAKVWGKMQSRHLRCSRLGEALYWAWPEEQCWQDFSSWLSRRAHPGGCKQQPPVRELDLEGTSHATEKGGFQGHGVIWDWHLSFSITPAARVQAPRAERKPPLGEDQGLALMQVSQHSHGCWVLTGRKPQSSSLLFSPCIHMFVIKNFQMKINPTPVTIRVRGVRSTPPDPKERL